MRVLGSLVLSALGPSVAAFLQPPCSTYRFCRVTASGAIRWPQQHRSSSDASCCAVDVTSRPTTSSVRARPRGRSLVAGQLSGTARGETPDAAPTTTTPHATAFYSAGAEPAVEDGSDSSRTTTGTPTAAGTAAAAAMESSSTLPVALLNAVTLLWGTQHAIIKLILQGDLSPGITNFSRFIIAALLFSPWTPGLLRDPPPLPFSPKKVGDSLALEDEVGVEGGEEGHLLAGDDGDGGDEGGAGAAETWRAGAELGVWMFLGFAFQSIGLGFTTAR